MAESRRTDAVFSGASVAGQRQIGSELVELAQGVGELAKLRLRTVEAAARLDEAHEVTEYWHDDPVVATVDAFGNRARRSAARQSGEAR